jgi:HPt (histidine-containing phosphotransfer) domain-containing protein
MMERWIPPEKREKTETKEKDAESARSPKRDAWVASTLSAGTEENEVKEVLSVEGLDVTRGIAMTGGTTEGYVEVLEIYCVDVADRLEFLKGFEGRVRDSLSGQSVVDKSALSLFVTQVHALKSASASVGAAEVSSLAAELESAGKEDRLDLIGEKLAAFTGNLTELAGRIKLALDRYANG